MSLYAIKHYQPASIEVAAPYIIRDLDILTSPGGDLQACIDRLSHEAGSYDPGPFRRGQMADIAMRLRDMAADLERADGALRPRLLEAAE